MSAMIESLNRVSAAWAGLMGAIVWQSSLVIAAVTVAAWLLRRSSPQVRYWLWQIVAIKMLLMPFWVLAVPWPFAGLVSPAAAPPEEAAPPFSPPGVGLPVRPDGPLGPPQAEAAPPAETAPRPEPTALWLVSWPTWLLLAWAGVVVWRVAWIARQRYGLRRLMQLTVPADGELAQRVGELARRLGLRRGPRVLLVDHPGLLFVCGLWAPKLVLPQTLSPSLSPKEIDQVVLHELAHLRRGDLYWGWTIELARIVYFFHPLVYWVGYCLHLERELACDQVAMSASGEAAGDYAQTLVRVAGHAAQPTTSQAETTVEQTHHQTTVKTRR